MGESGVAATVDAAGRLLSVSQNHPEHGVVVLESRPAFPERNRRDAAAVRRYRHRLGSRAGPAFGLVPERPVKRHGPAPAWLIEDAVPLTTVGPSVGGSHRTSVATFVPHPHDADGARGVLQVWRSAEPLRWRGALRMGRAAYTQVTEAGPLRSPERRPSIEPAGSGILIFDPGLGWAVAVAGDLAPNARVVGRSSSVLVDAPLSPDGRTVVLGVGRDREEALAAAHRLTALDPDEALDHQVQRWRTRWSGWPELGAPDAVARRAMAYTIGCCAIPVGDTVCLVTDHRILPLVWTRDGYYMARALLAWHRSGGPREAARLVRGHLAWLFETAERPRGWWARSHLVGGQAKDAVFQLDQQLYPLLELADYVEATADREPLRHFAPMVEQVLSAVEARRSAGVALFATEENPADDPLELPYQTANHILAWRTFSRLHDLGIGGGRLAALAARIFGAIRDHQVVPWDQGSRLFAYATDLQGAALLYHDANDLPMALAPRWGFCPPDDPVWRETMRFAFSPANPGFFGGAHGGLGSLHTPGPWSLGHVQARIVAHSTADHRLSAAAERKLLAGALWDGALPEAGDPRTGRPRARPWFAWPGAAFAEELLTGGSGPGGLEKRP